jgi:hypothetical protein
MITKESVKQALQHNVNWFIKSGIMMPADGSWGVAERLATTENNSAIDKMYSSFPAWTECDGYSIIEQRRADCNFEVALQFLLAAEALEQPEYKKIAENILDFLYFRSGLLNRFNGTRPIGAWNWSHIKWEPNIWFDDNGWNGVIQLIIARKYPEFDKKYQMTHWACQVAESMLEAFQRTFKTPHPDDPAIWSDPKREWLGHLNLPHWGALSCMLFAIAYSETGDETFAAATKQYFDYVWEERDNFIVSEDAYALIGATFASTFIKDSLYLDTATFFADKIISKMDDETGNIPAEHREAPIGPHLADMIYTVNWALLGMQMQADDCQDSKYQDAYNKLLTLTLNIQDKVDQKQFHGCWRGMYDMNANNWGGGDCYEGGAGSIYSGWTNAPISWVLAYELLNSSLNSR